MKIIDIMKNSSHLLGLSNEIEKLQSITEQTESEVLNNANISKMFELSKFAIQEICTNYIPICSEEKFTTTNKEICFSNITNCLKVLKVQNEFGDVNFKILSRKIMLETDGEYTVKYTTYPVINSVFDELDFLNNLSPDVVVFALCSYYSLSMGMFEMFKSFYEQYIDSAENVKQLKIFDLPTRRWL